MNSSMERPFIIALIFLQSWTLAFATPSPKTVTLNIKTDQFGYRPNDTKVAVIAQPQTGFNAPSKYQPGFTFKIRRWNDDVEVFSADIVQWKNGATHTQSGDKVWWFDFSDLKTAGEYYVEDPDNKLSSHKFVIHNNVYTSVLRAATKALFYQRCGTEIASTHGETWTHTVCHNGSNQDLACRDVETPNNAASEKNLSGGWHDAGDYNKYVNYTYNAVHNLLFAYQETPSVFTDNFGIPESNNGIPDVLDEVKYELDWLLKMQNADGSVLSKVSVVDYAAGSPPNTDAAKRFYGKASTSSTLTAASVFAHASLVFKTINPSFSITLAERAQRAWNWAISNPSVIYQNKGFESSSPELTPYETASRKTCAAAMLFAATNQATYKNYFESNYTNLRFIQVHYFSSFEATYNDIALFYTTVSGASINVSAHILANFKTSTATEKDLFPSFLNQTDAYRAYMNDIDYVWGSNMQKALIGVMYEDMIRYNQNPLDNGYYRTQGLDYLHFLHGVNPLSIVMLSNSGSLGADFFATEIYHDWTGDGTVFDKNPIPALLTGGINKDFSVKTISPPANQPVQKSYKDWNTSDPENSWEITEPAIAYQAAYIHLVSKYATTTALPPDTTPNKNELTDPLSIFPNPTNSTIAFQFYTQSDKNFSVQIIDKLGRVVFKKSYKDSDYQQSMDLPIRNLASGTYHLKLMATQGTYLKSFVITR
jgi:endoglucanase